MKKIAVCFIALLLVLPLYADYNHANNFIATAISVADNTTVVDGDSNLTSRKIPIGSKKPIGALTVWFTPAVGAAVTIDFEFAVSCDNGVTWTTGIGADAWVRIRVNTNVNAISSVVVVTEELNFHGKSHVKLYRIVVNSGAGNCTAINARLSIGG